MGACAAVCNDNYSSVPLEELQISVLHEEQIPVKLGLTENLSETSAKISTIDMNRHSGEAGGILDRFYSGMKSAKELDFPVVYAGPAGQVASDAAAKNVCNAKPYKKGALLGKVPPLDFGADKTSDTKGSPIAAGVLTVGALALGVLGRKKGYFSNYGNDVDTIIDAAQHPGETAHDLYNYLTNTNQGNSAPAANNNSQSPPKPDNYTVSDSAASTVTCPTGACGLP